MILRRTSVRLGLLLLIATPGGVLAQTTPSVVEEVKTVTLDENRAAFLIRFSPAEPQTASLNNNPTRPELLLRSTLRAPRVAPRENYRGLVRSATFETTDSGLLWRFDTAAPAQVSVQPAGDRSLQVIVQRLSGDEAIGARPIGSGGEVVEPATSLPAYVEPGIDGDSYELVPLKYADVSEVIGLLVEGETIQPNNVFIRREPGFGSIATASSNQYQYQQQQNQQPQNQQPLGQSFPGRGLAIDRRLNAIWITGTPERIARVKAQINAIDVPVDSVILETQFVELTEQGVRNLGLDLANRDGQIAVGQITLGAEYRIRQRSADPVQVGRAEGGHLCAGPERRRADRQPSANRRAIGPDRQDHHG